MALGGFILLFGFFAFNGGSQASVSQPGDAFVISNAVVNTILSGASAAIVSLSVSRTGFGSGKWSLLTTINGGLAGMVSHVLVLSLPLRLSPREALKYCKTVRRLLNMFVQGKEKTLLVNKRILINVP